MSETATPATLVEAFAAAIRARPDAVASGCAIDLATELVDEVLPEGYAPCSSEVAWATGAIAASLRGAGLHVESALPAGRISDALHVHDGLGHIWVLRVVGLVPA